MQPDGRYIGPAAEDFVSAFDVWVMRQSNEWRDNGYLAAGDMAGVALAGVQTLIEQNRQTMETIDELKKEIAELKPNSK